MRFGNLAIVACLFACGPAVADDDAAMESGTDGETVVAEGSASDADPTGGSETVGGSADASSATTRTSGETSVTAGETDQTDATGSETDDTAGDPPEFDDGDDDCLGPDGAEGAQGCSALAAGQLLDVVVEDESGDGVWSAGERLRVTLDYAAGDEDINAPAIVAQVDLASREYVSVMWIWWNWFYVFAGEQVEYEVVFTAEPDAPAGAGVSLRLGLASNHGNLTQCDCPDFEVDGWTHTLTIE